MFKGYLTKPEHILDAQRKNAIISSIKNRIANFEAISKSRVCVVDDASYEV